jgi:hypothetical protein
VRRRPNRPGNSFVRYLNASTIEIVPNDMLLS